MSFRILAAADLEMIESAEWYDDQRAGLGEEFTQEIQRAYARIRHNPLLYSCVEHYQGDAEVRRCLLERFPYIIVYRFQPDETLVVAVAHVRRKPFYWLERLP